MQVTQGKGKKNKIKRNMQEVFARLISSSGLAESITNQKQSQNLASVEYISAEVKAGKVIT